MESKVDMLWEAIYSLCGLHLFTRGPPLQPVASSVEGPSLAPPATQGFCFATIELNFINTDSKDAVSQVG